jgi:hypothetical protein
MATGTVEAPDHTATSEGVRGFSVSGRIPKIN